jgi:hypothetical protein
MQAGGENVPKRKVSGRSYDQTGDEAAPEGSVLPYDLTQDTFPVGEKPAITASVLPYTPKVRSTAALKAEHNA